MMYVQEVSVFFKALGGLGIINTKWDKYNIACIGICVYLTYLRIMIYVVLLT